MNTQGQWMIRSMLVSAFIVILNETLFGVAIPALMDEFEVTAPMAQWTSTVVLLTLGAVMPVSGYLIRRFQTRTVFFIIMSVVLAGSMMGAFATEFAVVIVARFIQAVGTGLMLPLLYYSIVALVLPVTRGVYIARAAVVFAVAPLFGPPVSGLLIEVLGWRSLFASIALIALLILVAGVWTVRPTGPSILEAFDTPSLPLSFLGVGILLAGIGNAVGAIPRVLGGQGDAAVSTIAIAAGLTLIFLFSRRQFALQRIGMAPFLDLSILRVHQFAIAIAITSIASLALFAGGQLVVLFFIVVMSQSPSFAGILLVPGALVQAALAPLVGRTYDRFGARALVLGGSVALCGSMVLLALSAFIQSLVFVVACHVFASIAMALLFAPLAAHGLASIDLPSQADGTAILGAFQHIIGAIGVVVLVSIASTPQLFEWSPRLYSYPFAFALAALVAAVAIPLAAMLTRGRPVHLGTSEGIPVKSP